jgi:hypothetical protein
VGSETSCFTRFCKSLLGLAGFVTDLGARSRANLAWDDVLKGLVRQVVSNTSCFTRFLWILMVSVPAAVGENPRCCCMFLVFRCFAKSRNLVIYNVSGLSVGRNLVFLNGLVENTARSEVCGGSGAQEPNSPRKSMARGRGERPRAEKHGLELPCTRFGRFCRSKTSNFIAFEEFPMAKVSCF